jgi:hypothetical protein
VDFMRKLKGFYKNNRVYVILMGIAALCLIIILSILLSYFTSQTRGSHFGNRLQGIENMDMTDTRLKSIETSLNEEELVESSSVRLFGRIIYMSFFLKDEAKPDDVKTLATGSLDLFSDDEKEFFDMSFLFDRELEDEEDRSFPIIGYKRGGHTTISWTNLD